jgi:hypothetical protein
MNMKNLRHKLLMLILAAFLVSYGYSQQCPSGMVSYWKMEETSGTVLDDAYANNNAATDVPLGSDASGKVGNAVILNGSNTVDIASASGFNFSSGSGFTVELWVKFTDVSFGDYDHVFVGRGDYQVAGLYWAIGAEHNTGKIFFDLRDQNGSGSSNFQNLLSPGSYNNGSWHHIVAVREAHKNVLYIDGSQVASVTYDYPAGFSSSSYISVGYLLRSGDPAYQFAGSLDELAIYNRGLSQLEVTDHNSKGNLGIGYCDGYNPNIISLPVTKATVNSPYSYTVRATGLTAGMAYTLLNKPAGMTINSSTGVISWTPTTINVDAFVKVRADNGIAPADTQSYRIFLAEAPVCPSNLLALFKLDETSGPTYFDFYGAHNATAASSPSATTGIIGGGQNFTDATQIDIPENTTEFNWSSSASFSIEFWIKTVNAADKVCVARMSLGNGTFWFAGTNAGGTAQFELRDSWNNYQALSGNTVITDGVWHHIVAVRDASSGKNIIYVDGAKDNEVSVEYPHSFSADDPTNITIGYLKRANPDDEQYHFNGSMDEIGIYTRAVTQSEAQASFNNRHPVGHCALGNFAPVITSVPVTTGKQDKPYSYVFTVDDVDQADVIVLSAVTKPDWLLFTFAAGQKSATLTGTPTNAFVGNFPVTLRVSDGHIQRDQAFTIVVENVNDLPVVTSTPSTLATEDEAYTYTLTVTDADLADVIHITVNSKPSWLNFDYVNGNKTATLSGTPENGDVGSSTVDLSIGDGTATVPYTYQLVVAPVNDAPVITAQTALSTDEDVAITLQKSNFTITDVDNQASDVTLSVKPGAHYTASGTVVTPEANFNGQLTVIVVASDPNLASEDFAATITVNPVNDAPVVISTDPDLVAHVGDLYAYVFAAEDVDANTTLTKTAVQIPSWLAFSPSTGVLTGTPGNADGGQTLIILRVSDGIVNVDYDFIIDVQGASGINDLESAGITIYPVPAKEFLNIEFERLAEETQLEVISTSGHTLKQVTIPANQTTYELDLNGLNNGTYLLHLKNSNLNNIGRFVITK